MKFVILKWSSNDKERKRSWHQRLHHLCPGQFALAGTSEFYINLKILLIALRSLNCLSANYIKDLLTPPGIPTTRDILDTLINLMCQFWDCGRKPKNLEKTHTGTEGTRKLCTERPELESVSCFSVRSYKTKASLLAKRTDAVLYGVKKLCFPLFPTAGLQQKPPNV